MQAISLQKTTETFTRRAKCRESLSPRGRSELDYFRMDERGPGPARAASALREAAPLERRRYSGRVVAKRIAVAGGAFSAALAACFADLSGFTGGAVEGDAAPEAVEAAAADAAGDAVDAAEAAPKSFCVSAGAHTLCDDFDTTADAGWTVFDTFGGGTGARDLAVFASPPAAYAVTTPMVSPDGGEAWMFPVRRLPVAITHVHLEAKVQACATVGDYVLLSINNRTATDAYGTIDFGVRPTADGSETFMVVKHDAFSKDFKLGPALPSTRFVRVAIDTDISKTSGSVKLSIDGAVVVDATNLPTDQAATVTKRSAFVGVYAYESAACTARIDDVLLDAK